ncbi:MAG: hypothetical protein ACOC6H_01825 [Thermoproteota archaeon]
MSSGEVGFGLMLAEKFFGLILLVVGALFSFYTITSMEALGDFTGFFGVLSIAFLGIGLMLIIAKTE